MPRFSSQTLPTPYYSAPTGVAARLGGFLTGMIRFEPAASAIYAENARIRDTGRTWLM